MKSGRKPTKRQKIALREVGLNPNNWLVVKKFPDYLHITHRETGRLRKLNII